MSNRSHPVEEVVHRRRLGDNGFEAIAFVEHLAKLGHLFLELSILQLVHHSAAKLVEVDRLGEVIVRTDLHSLDG